MTGAPVDIRVHRRDHPLLARSLKLVLEKRMQELVAFNGNGSAQDWADYKFRSGQIQGYKEAIDLCAEVEKQLGD